MSYLIHSHEFQLALYCTALEREWAAKSINEAESSKGLNEILFLEIIRRHHVEELAFQILKHNQLFSQDFQSLLKQKAEANQIKSIKGLSTQIHLQHYFTEKGIPAIFLKGLIISYLYYGDIGKRNVVDIDVWIPDDHFADVKSFLSSLGYQSIQDQYNWNEKQKHYLKLFNHDEIFVNKDDLTAPVIELHWKLRNTLGNFMFDPVRDQQHLKRVELGGVVFSVFNHVDQFVFLCVHGAEHGWFKLKWLVDLFHITKTVQLDWSAIVLRAKELRSLKEVRLACKLLEEFYGMVFSDEISLSKLTIADRYRLRYVKHLITYENKFCDTQREKILNLMYTLSLNKKLLIPKELIFKNLTTTTDWLTLPLPNHLFFLYFPLRPFLWLYRKVKS